MYVCQGVQCGMMRFDYALQGDFLHSFAQFHV